MDGKMVAWEKAKIHVLTHTLHYSGGVFEGIRFYKTAKGPAIFRLKEHINRLFYSASVLDMKMPFTRTELKEAIIQLIKVNKLEKGYIRPLVYYGYKKMGLDPRGCPVKIAIIAWPWGAYLGDKPVSTNISSYMRIHPNTTKADAKICGNYTNSILASLESHKKGYDEALLFDHKGYLAEGPGENVFIVRKGTLITPPKGTILLGITRNSIIEIAQKEKIPVKEQNITKKMLLSADEAFFTGTAAEVSPIAMVNKKKIGKQPMGPMTGFFQELFTKITHGEVQDYKKWLTLIQ